MEQQNKKRCGNCKYQNERRISNDGKYWCDRYGILLIEEDLTRAFCECFQAKKQSKGE